MDTQKKIMVFSGVAIVWAVVAVVLGKFSYDIATEAKATQHIVEESVVTEEVFDNE